jgi:hypothetical protein
LRLGAVYWSEFCHPLLAPEKSKVMVAAKAAVDVNAAMTDPTKMCFKFMIKSFSSV